MRVCHLPVWNAANAANAPGGLGGSQTLDVLLALGEWHGSVSDLRVNVFLEGICRPLREELLSAIDLEGLQFCVLIHLPSRHQALAMSRRLVAREMRPLKSPHVPVQLVDLVLSLELSRGGDRAQNLLDLLVLGGQTGHWVEAGPGTSAGGVLGHQTAGPATRSARLRPLERARHAAIEFMEAAGVRIPSTRRGAALFADRSQASTVHARRRTSLALS